MNSYYLVQIYATVVWINTKVAWNHTIKLWNLGSKMFPKNSVSHWMMECETFFSISALLAELLIKRSENYFLSGPTRYEFILHWYEFIPAWYIFMLRGLFWHTDRVFCCSTLKPAPISVKVAVMIIIIMYKFYVICVLLILKICFNICKSICNDNDKIMGNWVAKLMKALYNIKIVPI